MHTLSLELSEKKVASASRSVAKTKAIKIDENLFEARRDKALESSDNGTKNECQSRDAARR